MSMLAMRENSLVPGLECDGKKWPLRMRGAELRDRGLGRVRESRSPLRNLICDIGFNSVYDPLQASDVPLKMKQFLHFQHIWRAVLDDYARISPVCSRAMY